MAAYDLIRLPKLLSSPALPGRRHPMGSTPAKLAITNGSSPGLNHISALARIFSDPCCQIVESAPIVE
jgi:hypothetical protein